MARMDPNTVIDTHSGDTGIAIGNGPSLNDVPRQLLTKYPTFGVNFIHLLPFQPKYYICVDTPILTKRSGEIMDVASKADTSFINSYHVGDQIPELQNLYQLPNVILMGRDTYSLSGEKVMSGWTGVYVALKIAFQMGFSRMLLVGVDHSQDWGHFSENYPSGDQMTQHRFAGQREHYQIAQDTYEADNRRIVNLSPSSPLDAIFTRGSYEDWL